MIRVSSPNPRKAPYEKQLERLWEQGVKTYQEFSGYLGPRCWELTMTDGTKRYACKVSTLKDIADSLETGTVLPPLPRVWTSKRERQNDQD